MISVQKIQSVKLITIQYMCILLKLAKIHFRLLLAVLLKHLDLGHVVLSLIEHGQGEHGKTQLPKSLVELFKVVNNTKRNLIKVRSTCSYRKIIMKQRMYFK